MKINRWIDRLDRIAEVVGTRGGLRRLQAAHPRSLASWRLVNGIPAGYESIRSVIDVGANRGQFSAACLARWPNASIFAFEPLRTAACEFSAQRSLRDVRLTQAAVGAKRGTVTLNEHSYSLASSILPTHAPREREPVARVVQQVTLDESTPSPLARPSLLKLDVQGYEVEVIKGSKRILQEVDLVVVEVCFTQTYRDQPLVAEVNAELADEGFRIAALLDWHREDGRVVEADILYERESYA